MTCVVDAAEKESGERLPNQQTENAERLEVKETKQRNSGRNGAIVLFNTEKKEREQTLAATFVQVTRIGADGLKELQQFG